MDDLSSPSTESLSDDGELESVNAKVASLEEANEEVERLLRQVLNTQSEAQAKLDAEAERDSGETEPFRELAVPDVLGESATVRPESKPEAKVTPQYVEQLRAATSSLNTRGQKPEHKETGFFASIGAAVMRLLRME